MQRGTGREGGGCRDHRRAIRCAPDGCDASPRGGCADYLRPFQPVRLAPLAVQRRTAGAGHGVDHRVEQPRDILLPRLLVGIPQSEILHARRATVEALDATGVVHAQSRTLGAGHSQQEPGTCFRVHRAQRLAGERNLPLGLAHPLVEDARAKAVQIEEAAGDKRQGEDVDEQDARRERNPPRAAGAQRLLPIPPRSGSRRHRASRWRRTRSLPAGTCAECA